MKASCRIKHLGKTITYLLLFLFLLMELQFLGVYSQICFDLLMENREFSVLWVELCHHLHEHVGIGGLTLSGIQVD